MPPRLAAQLTDRDAWRGGVPALADEDVDEAMTALAAYEGYPPGCSDQQIGRMMIKLAVGYPASRVSQAESDARLALYVEQLSDLDFDILSAGFAAAVKECRFFPTVAEIRALAKEQPMPERMWRAYQIKRMLWEREHSGAREAGKTPSREEAAAIMAKLRVEHRGVKGNGD